MAIQQSTPRVDAIDKVTGSAVYPADTDPADALHAMVVFSGEAHARMIAIDTKEAETVDGVVAVLTAKDVPVNEYGLTLPDQPVLVGLDGTNRSVVPADVSRWEADHTAIVVAESLSAAQLAASAIRVEWEPLPIFDNVDEALATSVLLHPENGKPTNEYYHLQIRKGDIKTGLDQAHCVVEGTYESPHQEHAFLQPEAAIAWLEPDETITITVAGQWTHEDRKQVAHALDLPLERVRVIYPTIGGAFGGREDMSLQIALGLAVLRCGQRGIRRPIRCEWSREESMVGHHKRHRVRVRHRLGATRDGLITSIEADIDLDAGAYNYTSNKVLGNTHLTAAGPYRVPHARIDSRAIYTTSVPGGAFRGFGAPQGAFAIESQLNKLAAKLGIDPVEIRRRNVLHDGDESITQVPLPEGVSLPTVIDACADRSRFNEPLKPAQPFSPIASLPARSDRLRRGRGFAAAFKNVGFSFGFPERCEAEIRLYGGKTDEQPTHAELLHSAAEVGQGAHTAYLQMTAEATGLPLGSILGTWSDTRTSGDSGSASASRLTWMGGHSILGAAEEAEKAWRDGKRPAIGKFRFVPPATESLDPTSGAGQPNFAYGYVAQAVEITLDVDTGTIRVDRVTSTHDVGKAINPSLVAGQIEGGVVQAHGYALSEDLRVVDGCIVNPRFSGYLIPGIADKPLEVDAQILEIADPRGPWGARGLAEMPMIPYAAAIAAAIFDATGVWIDAYPFTPTRVMAALRAR